MAQKIRVVAQKGYGDYGIPYGAAIGLLTPQSGMLTNKGTIQTVVINGAGSGNLVQVGSGGVGGGTQGYQYEYCDRLCIYSGNAVGFGFLTGLDYINLGSQGGISGTPNNAIGYFATGGFSPTSFTLPRAGE